MPDFGTEADSAARKFAKRVRGDKTTGIPKSPLVTSTETTMAPGKILFEWIPTLGEGGGGGGGGGVPPPPTGNFILLTDGSFLLKEDFDGILEA